jgi:hypothetical protein
LAQIEEHKVYGSRVTADTTEPLCVDGAICGTEGTKVAYGPYKATNGYLYGQGQHIVFDQFGNVDDMKTSGLMRPLNIKVTAEENY